MSFNAEKDYDFCHLNCQAAGPLLGACQVPGQVPSQVPSQGPGQGPGQGLSQGPCQGA